MEITETVSPEAKLENVINASAKDDKLSKHERKLIRQVLQDVVISPNELIDYSFYLADQSFQTERRRITNWQREFVLFASELNVPMAFLTQGVWFSPGSSIRSVLLNSIHAAVQKIEVSVYNLTDDRLARALVTAVKRDVEVFVVTEQSNLHQPGSDVIRLQKAGVQTYVVARGASSLMHHKYAIFDRRFVLSGSYNWTNNATKNDENLVLVGETDRVSQYVENFSAMIRSFCP